jgi:hypothetical protein
LVAADLLGNAARHMPHALQIGKRDYIVDFNLIPPEVSPGSNYTGD